MINIHTTVLFIPKRFLLHKKGALLGNGFYCTSRLLTLLGCHEEALGMENGKIPDSAIKANYEVDAVHIYTCILFDDTSGGLALDTVSYFYRTQIWRDCDSSPVIVSVVSDHVS